MEEINLEELFTTEDTANTEMEEINLEELFTTENTGDTEMKEINEITGKIIGSAIEVHKALGPGLMESAYETCLEYELKEQGIYVERQKALPIIYKNVQLDAGYRLDLLVEGRVIVELKAVEKIVPIHQAQLLSYLKLSGCFVGLLINFNVKLLKNGISRLKV